MSNFMRRLGLASALGMVAVLGACGDDDPKPTDTTDTRDTSGSDTSPETSPDAESDTTPDAVTPTFATLTFAIDDSANKTFDASDMLVWKGSFTWDEATNLITFDGSWGGGSGPYPLLYDDGPPPNGNEKPGAVAGDGIWTTAVQIATPEAELTLEYGAAYGEGSNSWIWPGPGNGTVTVPAGSEGQIDAVGMTVAPHGTIDFWLIIDVSNFGEHLAGDFKQDPTDPDAFEYTDVKVKSSAWGWSEIAMVDDGSDGDEMADDGIFTFVLSENLSKHGGLLKPGDKPQFVFVLDGVEYKVDGAPPTAGVEAAVTDGTTAVELEIMNLTDDDMNTYVEVPSRVAVTFTIDDSANGTYDAADNLEWKGSFKYDSATNTVEFDGSWGGPYPKLYDDGPAPDGNEAPGAVAGDNIWTTEVLFSNAGGNYEYGAQRTGDAWIWTGSNGTFTIPAGTLTPIVAPGLTIAAHGTIDLRLEIDVSDDGANLNAGFQSVLDVDYTNIKVKGSAWGWAEKDLLDDGSGGDITADDGTYTFLLSNNLGKHEGLLKLGDKPEFIFVIDGVEYKTGEGEGAQEGVSAWTDHSDPGENACVAPTAMCTVADLEILENKNTAVTVGPPAE